MSPKAIVFVLIFIIGAQSIYYYPLLPETMAMHFDGAGKPNGWGSKNFNFGIYYGITLLLYWSLVLLPGFFMNRADGLMNVRYKEYWLAPERKEQSISFLKSQLFGFWAVTTLFIILVMQFVFMANLASEPRLSSSFMALFVVFMIYSIYWTLYIVRYFGPPEDEVLVHSMFHRFFKTILPAKGFRAIAKGTKQWLVECPKCKDKRCFWESGGVRYKAAGEPRQYGFCKSCKSNVWFKVRKKTDEDQI